MFPCLPVSNSNILSNDNKGREGGYGGKVMRFGVHIPV